MQEEKIYLFNTLKNFSYLGVLFINPQSYAILGVLIIIDTITGIIRSGVVHGWRSITSHCASVGILAKLMLLLVPLTLSLTAHGVGVELTFIARAALNILILSEAYSILSNIQSTRLKRDIAEFDAINYALKWMRGFLERNIKKPDSK